MKNRGFKIIDHTHGLSYNTPSRDNDSGYIHIDVPQSYSKSLLVSGLITTFFIFQKISNNLLTKWQACFYLFYAVILIKFFLCFLRILDDNSNIKEMISSIYEKEEFISKVENLMLLSSLVSLIHYTLCFFLCYFFAEYMDTKLDEYVFYLITVVSGILINQLIFSVLADSSWFNVKRSSEDLEANRANDEKTHSDSWAAFFVGLTTPLLTYLSNMTMICSANSGVCTQFYLSTLTSLLGAFGITISNLSEYLFPITVVMLIVSNISLYVKRRKLTHPPFLLGVFSTFLIIISKIFEDSLWLLMYIGNISMIVAAVWNMRMNKFYGLPSRKK